MSLIRAEAIENDDEIKEYAGERTQREIQVGNRADKIKADGSTVTVNRIPIPFQNQIVRTAASFLFGAPVNIATDEDVSEFKKEWTRRRMDHHLLEACESAKAYKQSAILYRLVKPEGQDMQLKVLVLKPTKGTLIPLWSEFEELDAFIYETKIEREGETVTRIYIYTDTNVQILEEGNDGITEVSNLAHGFDRIPVVYIEEEQSEYHEVRHLIDRFENRFSRFADTNDYFSSPFFKALGTIENVPEKDDTGSVFMMDVIETDTGQIISSDLDVVSWDSAPEATKMEFEITKGLIYDLSNTPDLSFDNVKGLGNISGVALKLMFLSTIAKTRFSERIYAVAVKRAVSVLNSGLEALSGPTLNLEENPVTITFNSIPPEHIQETLESLGNAVLNKPIMSQETALLHNPMVTNVEEEISRLKAEEASVGETFNNLDFGGQ